MMISNTSYKCRSASYTLLSKIDVVNHYESHITLPLSRYIMSIFCAVPVKHIILGERPYKTNILPLAASAMSYDPIRQIEPTPSVHYIARDVSNFHDISYDTVKDWFQDSWKYLHHGIVLLNVCTYKGFMDPRSDIERVAMEEFIRDIINISTGISGEPVHVYPMGNPAQHSVGRIRSSLKDSKTRIKVHNCKNPAWASYKNGDQRSPASTLSNQPAIRLLYNIVASTTKGGYILTEQDYVIMSTGPNDELTSLIASMGKTSDVFEKIEDMFKDDGKRKDVMTPEQIFNRVKTELRDLSIALQNVKIRTLFLKGETPATAAKQTFYNQRHPHVPRPQALGTSVRTPSVASSAQRAHTGPAGFADDEDDIPPSSSAKVVPSASKQSLAPPVTPTPSRVGLQRHGSQRSQQSSVQHVGLIDEESDVESIPQSVSVAASSVNLTSNNAKSVDVRGSSTMTRDEIIDLKYIANFVEVTDDYSFNNDMAAKLSEAAKIKSAPSGIAAEALAIIRETRSNPEGRSIKNALGYEDNIVDVPSLVIQWLQKYAESD